MANDEQTRDRWVQGLRHLIAMNSQKRRNYLVNDKKFERQKKKEFFSTFSFRSDGFVVIYHWSIKINQKR